MNAKPHCSLFIMYDMQLKIVRPALMPYMLDSGYAIKSFSSDNLEEPSTLGYGLNAASISMPNHGLLVVIVKSQSVSSLREMINNHPFPSQCNILLMVINENECDQSPEVDKYVQSPTYLATIRLDAAWVGRFIHALSWTYGRYPGLIQPDIDLLIEAIASLYPMSRHTYIIENNRLPRKLTKMMARESKKAHELKETRWVFAGIASKKLTIGDFESIGHVISESFSKSHPQICLHTFTNNTCSSNIIFIDMVIFHAPDFMPEKSC